MINNKPFCKMIIKEYSDVYNYMLDILKQSNLINVKRGKYSRSYYDVPMGFDIETTNTCVPDGHFGYMYHWQLAFNDLIILGREWWEFEELIARIVKINKLSSNRRIICWIANLSFEFQFLRKRFEITEVFAREKRQPLKALINAGIELRDCLALTGGSLYSLAKDYTTTQKLVGDLDYAIERNAHTPLDQVERGYCINDVWILAEWAIYTFETYLRNGIDIPLTKTGILRNKIKKTVEDSGKKKEIMGAIQACMPDEQLYRNMMAYLFRGGFVHACARFCKMTLRNIYSFDETSAYPAAIYQSDHFPTRFFQYQGDPRKIDTKKYCWIAVFDFYCLKAKTHHSIESKSKCIEIEGNRTIDNGRICYADHIKVFLTDLDYRIYDLFYSWRDIEITYVWRARSTRLPGYLINNMVTDYKSKNDLKRRGLKDTIEYALSKEAVNSYYGMMVTRLYESEVSYADDQWAIVPGKSYEKQIQNLFLLPQWGIYVTAIARYRLLVMTFRLHLYVVYNDTDSIKLTCYNNHVRRILAEYNQKLINLNNQLSGGDPDLFNLGTFDYEGCYRRFKTLGAKRYIYYDDSGSLHAVISGLPDAAEHLKASHKPFDTFNDEMEVDCSRRLVSEYHDEEYSGYVAGELMYEKSGVALYETHYKLTISGDYRKILAYIKNQVERRSY